MGTTSQASTASRCNEAPANYLVLACSNPNTVMPKTLSCLLYAYVTNKITIKFTLLKQTH